MKLYHTSSLELRSPDVDYGRKNADFGGGFYLSDNVEFSKKWSGNGKTIVNIYTLDLSGLKVKRFERDGEWFNYITKNRFARGDEYADTDVIIGPIANDTLYDTYGIIFSGLLTSEEALSLLKVGKQYTQINVKTKKAASQLKWEGAQILSDEEISLSRAKVREEEAEFRSNFDRELTKVERYAEIEEILS